MEKLNNTEEEEEKKRIQNTKKKLLSIAALGATGSLTNNFASPAAIKYTFKKEYEHYPDAVNKRSSSELYKKIVEAHKQVSGLSTPTVYTTSTGTSAYHMEPGGSGYVELSPYSGAFTLAHELGHRQIHKSKGIIKHLQDAAPRLSESPLTMPALIGLAATQNTPLKAIKNTALLSYLSSAPTIISELVATQKGMQYLSKAGVPGSKSLSVSQAIPYLLAPVGQALVAAATGQAIRYAGQKLRSVVKAKKKKNLQEADTV